MTQPAWARQPRPAPGPGAHLLGRWEPATLADLTRHRRQLSAALHDGARPPGTPEVAVEALILLFEELVSNAVRHGRPPVIVEVTAVDGSWLLDVSDAAIDRPPHPAAGRDPADGGLGLHLTTALSAARGWAVIGDRKHVWARIARTRHSGTSPHLAHQHGEPPREARRPHSPVRPPAPRWSPPAAPSPV